MMSDAETLAGYRAPSRTRQSLSRLVRFLRLLGGTAGGCFGLFIVGLLLASALLAPVMATDDPNFQQLAQRLTPPGAEFWLGSDELGRDIYSRIIHGSRPTLTIVMLVLLISAPFGLLLGTSSGYLGGWFDRVAMRVTDVCLAVPKLLLALAFAAALGPGIVNAALAIAITAWPAYARLARAETLSIRSTDYVHAAALAGASHWRVVIWHIAPMCLPSVIVRATFDMAGIILIAAGLGFIGLGAQAPMAEWGAMISSGRKFIFDQWWVATMPGIAIFVVSLGFNVLGDAVRDLLDPQSRSSL